MKRILVIGSGGSGKSTFARRLGQQLGIEVIHLDTHHWRAGWIEPPKDVWRQQVEELLKRESWVMDGNYRGTLDIRLAACDTVIFLDRKRTTCLWRVLKRVMMYRTGSRPDMALGCHEKFDLKFMLWVWGYPKRSRPEVLRRLEEHAGSTTVVHLRSDAEMERFLKGATG